MCVVILSLKEGEPEILLAKAFKDDLGVEINPQALRMFVRQRWARLATLAHMIHTDEVTA